MCPLGWPGKFAVDRVARAGGMLRATLRPPLRMARHHVMVGSMDAVVRDEIAERHGRLGGFAIG